MNFLLGSLGDNIWILWESARLGGKFSSDLPYGLYGHVPGAHSESLLWGIYFFLAHFVNYITLWNSFVILFLCLNLLLSFILFRTFFHKSTSLLLSLAWVISPYFVYHSSDHLSLLATFFYPITILLLLKLPRDWENFILFGIYAGMVFCVSNYVGFFNLSFILTYLIFESFFISYSKFTYIFPKLFSIILFFIVTAGVLSYSYIQGSILTKTSTNYLASRGTEEFFTFSSRPWYFLLPSSENPIFGNLTTGFVSYLQNNIKLWLANDYFASEHSASFIGWLNIVLALIGAAYVIATVYKYRFPSKSSLSIFGRVWNFPSVFRVPLIKLKRDNFYLVFTAVIMFFCLLSLVLLMMPPYITVASIKIYLPVQVFVSYFPYFRVTARLGILVYLLALIFVGYAIQLFIKRISAFISHIENFVLRTFIFSSMAAFYILVNFASLFVPAKVQQVAAIPTAAKLISEETNPTDILAVYPYSMVNTVLFTTPFHKRQIANPRDYIRPKQGFNSLEFTENLGTCEGINDAVSRGVNTLVYLRYEGSQELPNEILYKLHKVETVYDKDFHDKSSHFVDSRKPNTLATSIYRLNKISCYTF